jgi:hypothetical protein
MKISIDFLAKRRIPALAAPKVHVPFSISGPIAPTSLLEGKPILINVGVGNDFIDERHGSAPGNECSEA